MAHVNHYRLISDQLTYRIHHPDMWEAVGGIYQGILLEYLVGWCAASPDGWAYRTKSEIQQDVKLTRAQQDTARKQLEEEGLVLTKVAGLPARLYYQVDWLALDAVVASLRLPDLPQPLQADDEIHAASGCETSQPAGKNPANTLAGSLPSYIITNRLTNRKNIGGTTSVDAPPPKTSRGSRLPADWAPGEAEMLFGLEQGMQPSEVKTEAARFRDYWIAQPGQKGVKLDWPATWRNWIRRASDDQSRKRQTTRKAGGRYTVHDAMADLAASEAKDGANAHRH